MNDTKAPFNSLTEAVADTQMQPSGLLQSIESIHSSIEQAREEIQLKKKKMEERYRNGTRRTSGSII